MVETGGALSKDTSTIEITTSKALLPIISDESIVYPGAEIFIMFTS